MTLHARQQLPCTATESRRLPARAPASVAVERLVKLAVAGVPAQKMAAAAWGILADWRAEAMPSGVLREQLEALRTDIEGGLSLAEDYVADADERDRPKAIVQLDALRATQQVLRAEAERLS